MKEKRVLTREEAMAKAKDVMVHPSGNWTDSKSFTKEKSRFKFKKMKTIFKNPQGKLSDIRESLGVPRFLFGK